MPSAVATGGEARPRAPPPHFGVLKILFLEHNVTTRQQTMIEKEITMFKHISSLTFHRFFVKFLAINCCT